MFFLSQFCDCAISVYDPFRKGSESERERERPDLRRVENGDGDDNYVLTLANQD